MNCVNCASEDVIVFYIEEIPCKHCGGTTEVVYTNCNNCGIMCKTIDGVVSSNSFEVMDELDDVFDDGDVKILESLNAPEAETMQDLLHRCVRCNAMAYEKNPRYYCCPKCGFEWGIL
jgi:hypothetical protein